MNRARDQLLAGACFSLDKNGGIRRRDAFDLFEHRFQRSALTYDLLESALITIPITVLLGLSTASTEDLPGGTRLHFRYLLNSPEPLERSRAGLHR